MYSVSGKAQQQGSRMSHREWWIKQWTNASSHIHRGLQIHVYRKKVSFVVDSFPKITLLDSGWGFFLTERIVHWQGRISLFSYSLNTCSTSNKNQTLFLFTNWRKPTTNTTNSNRTEPLFLPLFGYFVLFWELLFQVVHVFLFSFLHHLRIICFLKQTNNHSSSLMGRWQNWKVEKLSIFAWASHTVLHLCPWVCNSVYARVYPSWCDE